MGEHLLLEDIVGEFIDDVSAQVEKTRLTNGDRYEINDLVTLFHNAYNQIDSDVRCRQFANEMSKWAMDYTKSVSMGQVVKPSEEKNGVPYFQLLVGGAAMSISTYEVMIGYSMIAMMGYIFSAILVIKGLEGIKKIYDEYAKPYKKYIDEIKQVDAQEMREALLAKKEYAYANLELVPQFSEL